MKTTPSQPSLNLAFFRKHFSMPGLVRIGIWTATMLGDSPVGAAVCKRAGLPPNCTMFEYADTLIRFAEEMGWKAQLSRLLEQDVQEALEDPAQIQGVETYKFLESRLPGLEGVLSFAAQVEAIDWTQPSDGTKEDLLTLLEDANV